MMRGDVHAVVVGLIEGFAAGLLIGSLFGFLAFARAV